MQERRAPLAQREAGPVEVQDALRVLLLRLHIDLAIVRVDVEPGLAGGEARVPASGPLDRGAGAVAAGEVDAVEPFLLRFAQMEGVEGVDRRDVQVLVDRVQRDVGHADLLPLVDERGPGLEDVAGGQHFSGLLPVDQASVAVDHSGVIVILQIERVPGLPGESVLPLGEGVLELAQPESVIDVLRHEAVRHHGVELDHHIQHAVPAADVRERRRDTRVGSLAHLDHAVLAGDLPELLQVGDQVRAVLVERQAVDGRHERDAVRQLHVLRDEGDHVLAESVDPHVQPEPHDVLDLFADLRIVHIQIRLLPGKNMQVILLPLRIVLPRQPLELAVPVVGRQARLPLPQGIPPDVVVAVRIVLPLAALQEPGVFVGRVVDHQVQEHLESQLMGAVQDLLKLFERSVVRVDVPVVGNVIAVVRVRGRKDRAEPDPVDPEVPDVLQFVIDAVQIADPVAVAVAEAPDPDLIEGHLSEIILPHHVLPARLSVCASSLTLPPRR